MNKQLIVTHHSPDLDAIGSVWLLKRFDTQHYGTSQVTFVDPGSQIHPTEAEQLGFQMHQVIHVDTGLGQFDHHQPERGHQHICASSLVYDHLCKIHPELMNDATLRYIVEFITEIDHFGEIHWPDAASPRYSLMIHELIDGFESVDPHNDDSQLFFGMQCLNAAYSNVQKTLQAAEAMSEGVPFDLNGIKAIGIESRNDQVVKYAQKNGYTVVIRKDPQSGEIRIKARPDSEIDLKTMHEKILQQDQVGTWYYHPSGKMLLNGSRKHRHQRPSPLTLPQIITLMKESYA